MKEISAKDIRWKLTEVLNEACYKKARFSITKNNKPVAVLMGVEDYQNIMEMLELLPGMLKSIESNTQEKNKTFPVKRRAKDGT